MKHNINKISLFPLLLLLLVACKKEKISFQSTASINVLNMVIGGGPVKVNASADAKFAYSKTNDVVGYGAGAFYQSFTGSRNITIVTAADTTNTRFSGTLNLLQGIHTLYVFGQAPAIDTMFRLEKDLPFIQVPKLNADSSVYIRFVNLSLGSPAINVKLTGATEFNNLAYKSISDFKKYEAKTTTAQYSFQLRNAVTDALLLTYNLRGNDVRHKTISLVIRGLAGGSGANALAVSQIVYY